ncbi:MAG: 5-oxoprolinase subunit PxpB [Bacteroidales bacterium]
MKFAHAGDSAVFVTTGDAISSELSSMNRIIIDDLRKSQIRGVKEFVSSYTGFLVCYDPLVTSYDEVIGQIKKAGQTRKEVKEGQAGGIIIPVAYGGEYGPDLNTVAEIHGLTQGEVANIHSESDYIVHMLGFTPGFPYLGGMDARISTPRKLKPSLHVEAGSVGIAEDQTGIYPVESPGGWQIIGRTPVILFDPERNPEFLLKPGMKVRLRAVDNYEFWSVCELITNGEYQIDRF